MWLKAFDGGRVNTAHVTALLPAGSGSNWVVNAEFADASTVKILDALPSKQDAVDAIDNLLLNGS